MIFEILEVILFLILSNMLQSWQTLKYRGEKEGVQCDFARKLEFSFTYNHLHMFTCMQRKGEVNYFRCIRAVRLALTGQGRKGPFTYSQTEQGQLRLETTGCFMSYSQFSKLELRALDWKMLIFKSYLNIGMQIFCYIPYHKYVP